MDIQRPIRANAGLSPDVSDKKASVLERDRMIECVLDANEQAGEQWFEQALLKRDDARTAIQAILDMAVSHPAEYSAAASLDRLCRVIGLKDASFSDEEAAAIKELRRQGALEANGPLQSAIDAARDRQLIQEVGRNLCAILTTLGDSDLVVDEPARRAGITTDIYKFRAALNELRSLAKHIAVLPYIDADHL